MRAALLPALLLTFGLTAAPVRACETALLLMIDVSSSIDAGEYRLQADGLATALRDPEIAEALVAGEVQLAVLQWSGPGQQALSLPWQSMTGPDAVERFARGAETMRRAFIASNTALGQALQVGIGVLPPDWVCTRRKIDVSGDGPDNAATDLEGARSRAERLGVQVNGLAIESGGLAVTGYFRGRLITRDGFVMSARGYGDYARALRAKLLAELVQPLF